MTIDEMNAEERFTDDRAEANNNFPTTEEPVYHRSIQQFGVTVTATRWTPEGLKAEVSVVDGAYKRSLHRGELCLTSLRDKEALGRFLEKAGSGPNWFPEIADFFAEVVEAERKAAFPVMLCDVEKPTSEPVFEVGGILLPRHHPAVLFGDGEAFKSLLALWFAGNLTLQGARVLFADWELDAPDHRVRLEALFGHRLPPVRYLRCDAPILSMASRLRDICQKDKIDYVMVDSVAFATGIPAVASEAATGYYAALRQIGVGGSLSIAHSTKKTAKADRGKEKPFGSVFWHNGARMTWLAQPVLYKDAFASVQLDCRKSNLVERPKSRLVEISFGPDLIKLAVTVGQAGELREQPTDAKRPSKEPSAREQIDELLRRSGPMTPDEIKNSLPPDVRPDTFRMALKRGDYLPVDGDKLWNEARLGSLEEWQKRNGKWRAPEHEHEQES